MRNRWTRCMVLLIVLAALTLPAAAAPPTQGDPSLSGWWARVEALAHDLTRWVRGREVAPTTPGRFGADIDPSGTAAPVEPGHSTDAGSVAAPTAPGRFGADINPSGSALLGESERFGAGGGVLTSAGAMVNIDPDG